MLVPLVDCVWNIPALNLIACSCVSRLRFSSNSPAELWIVLETHPSICDSQANDITIYSTVHDFCS